MSEKKIWAMYFSPTGTTEKIVRCVADVLAGNDQAEVFDFTLPQSRSEGKTFTEKDAVVFGVPVYAGRVPNVLLKYLDTVQGGGALAVPVVLYGNRNYDDALIELRNILEKNGFHTIAAGAFIGEHSFSKILAAGRPDDKDMELARDFASKIVLENRGMIQVKGEDPIRGYYQPRDRKGVFIDIRKVKPLTADSCTDCKLCAQVCPMGSISFDNVREFTGICIKCGSCIKKCPQGAKYYEDEGYLYHKHELEEGYTRRAEPEVFL
ncbi:EFR1 family ferrodoxin [Anaerovorax odorimutans]|uniref:EFR1 family ferrodoxin n=1 Tax=Anaerovorax odorimutans TaxID=109327 RepID=A0ABT1RSR4_9FIRM|nr:EFR1 family ferrodoxin [Anaerovorax odorimutans]MCQ4638253.1 EFR1 family ferrodoxin [Anaerovorax odorimutans]